MGFPRTFCWVQFISLSALKRIECTFSQFAEEIKSGRSVDLLDGVKICRGIWTTWIDGLRPTV